MLATWYYFAGKATHIYIYGAPHSLLCCAVHSNTGKGCPSVLNTYLSNGIMSSSVNMRYRYLSLHQRISQRQSHWYVTSNLATGQKMTTRFQVSRISAKPQLPGAGRLESHCTKLSFGQTREQRIMSLILRRNCKMMVFAGRREQRV